MYCICCKKNNVKPHQESEQDVLWGENRLVNSSMISGGIIHVIDAGYGSKHDGDQFIISICDDCINDNLSDQTILYYGSYMYNGLDSIEEEINKSKKLYNRRKNLDDLI
jgi:hypothetical protein